MVAKPSVSMSIKDQDHKLANVKLPRDKAQLKQMVDAAQSTITIHEGGLFIPLALSMMSVLVFIIAYSSFVTNQMLAGYVFTGFTAFAILLIVLTLRRYKKPYFIITPKGLETSVFQSPISWLAIQDFKIISAKSNSMNLYVKMEFLIDDAHLLKLNKACRSGSYYDEKTKKLIISGFNFKLDTNRDKIIETLNIYRHAALAAQALADKV